MHILSPWTAKNARNITLVRKLYIYTKTQRETHGEKNIYDIHDWIIFALLFEFPQKTHQTKQYKT